MMIAKRMYKEIQGAECYEDVSSTILNLYYTPEFLDSGSAESYLDEYGEEHINELIDAYNADGGDFKFVKEVEKLDDDYSDDEEEGSDEEKEESKNEESEYDPDNSGDEISEDDEEDNDEKDESSDDESSEDESSDEEDNEESSDEEKEDLDSLAESMSSLKVKSKKTSKKGGCMHKKYHSIKEDGSMFTLCSDKCVDKKNFCAVHIDKH